MTESDIFDPKLLQRLTRPLVQPGVISPRMARGIILRSQRFASRLPLLAIAQRHYNVAELKTEQLPIVYAQSRQDETQTASGISLGTNADTQTSQPEASQPTVVQAKFASAKSPASLPVNPNTQSVVPQQRNPANTLPLSSSAPLHSVPIQGNLESESVPIVYAQSRQDGTQTASGISLGANADAQTSQAEASQPTVVQAKFASAKSPASLTVNPDTQPVILQQQNPTNTLPLSTSFSLHSVPDQGNLGSQFIPIVYAQSRQDEAETANGISLGANANAQKSQPDASQPTVVQAKFVSAKSPASLTVNPDTQPVVPQQQNPTNTLPLSSSLPLHSVPNQGNLAPQSVPIVYAQSRQDEAVKTLINTVSTEEAIASPHQPSPPKKLVVRETRINSAKSNTPLVFSSPPAIAPQASQELPNRTIEELPTISMNPERSPVTSQSPPSPNLRPQVNDSNNLASQIDIDALAAKVERKLMRKLIVENERRGRKL